MPPTLINQLPYELITHIFSFLDGPPPFEKRMYYDPARVLEPDDDGYDSDDDLCFPDDDFDRFFRQYNNDDGSPKGCQSYGGIIKSVSLVSHLWRRCILPLLFRHVIWKFQTIHRPLSPRRALEDVPELEFLRFLVYAGIAPRVESLVIIVDYPEIRVADDLHHHLTWGIQPAHSPDVPDYYNYHDESSPPSPPSPPPRVESGVWDNNWLWHTLFEHLDLLSITLVSSPAILAALTSRPAELAGCWLYRQRFHILSLSRAPGTRGQTQPLPVLPSSLLPRPQPPDPRSRPPRGIACDLFSIREWTCLFLNEGSFVRSYSSGQSPGHPPGQRPPSLLPALLDHSDPSMERFLCSTLRCLTYVAIFPHLAHINRTLISHLPSIDCLSIQIAPLCYAHLETSHPRVIDTVWKERDLIHMNLMAASFDEHTVGGWACLRDIRFTDLSYPEEWEDFVRQVLINAGTRWKVAGHGRFVRRVHDANLPIDFD